LAGFPRFWGVDRIFGGPPERLDGSDGFGGDDFDFEEDFGPDELGDDEEEEGGPSVAEDAGADLSD
jgi:hypothetical protein